VNEALTASEIRAAGGVLWRRWEKPNGDETLEVAVVHRPRYDDWTLPKGKLAPGETELEAALREVEEETGHRGRRGRSLGTVRYLQTSGGVVRPKVVRYWALEVDGGHFTPHDEVDDMRWVDLVRAWEMLTHSTDREVLERFAGQRP
jgi:8-oxo-dGTP pyrophosphatase MutT (NUDIX family)